MVSASRLAGARLALSAAFVVAFVAGGTLCYGLALAIVAFFEVAEFLESRAERSRSPTWDLGYLLAPVVYCISRSVVLLCLVWAGYVPLWMVLLVVFRDMFVSYVRVAAIRSGKVLGARVSRSLKTFAQGVATVAIVGLIAATDRVDPFAVEAAVVAAHWLMGLVVVVALWSGWRCVRASVPILRGLMERGP